jgi:hypothetical protein
MSIARWSVVSCGVALFGAGTMALMAGTEPPSPEAIRAVVRCDAEPPATEAKEPADVATEKPATEAKPREKIEPKPLSDGVKKGLEYLVQQQHENGGWGQGGGWRLNGEGQGRVEGAEVKDPPDVGNTCIAALALIRAGNTPAKGPHAKQLAKAIDFIETHVEQADTDSLFVTPIRDTQLQSKIGRYVDTFLTALVLSELKGQMPDEKSEKRLFAALNKTVGKIEKNQQADGTFAGNAGWASILSQGLASKALNRAFQNGVAVKAETLDKDFAQTVAALDSAKIAPAASLAAGGVASSRIVTGSSPADTATVTAPVAAPTTSVARTAGLPTKGPVATSGPSDAGVQLYFSAGNTSRIQDIANSNGVRMQKAEATIADPKAAAPAKEAAKQELKQLREISAKNGEALAGITGRLDDQSFLAGFGNNGGEEFLSYMNISETLFVQGGDKWKDWDRKICTTVEKVQNQDGSWSGHHCITGRTFCTSAALLTILADRAPLPVAAAEPAKK